MTQDNITVDCLLDTRWNQAGRIVDIDNPNNITYNYFFPYNHYTIETDDNFLVGCTGVAIGQVLYYFIDKYDLDLPDNLVRDTVTVRYPEVQYELVNNLVDNFDTSSPECIAALLCATMLSEYIDVTFRSDATGGTLSYGVGGNIEYMFRDLGFSCVIQSCGNSLLRVENPDASYTVTDYGFDMMIENITVGSPVLAFSYGLKHLIVIDGYNSQNDTFHVNMGWGGASNGWYTRDALNTFSLVEFIYDIKITDDVPDILTVSNTNLYGAGSMARAFELAESSRGYHKIVFEDSVAGARYSNNLFSGKDVFTEDTLEIENYNVIVNGDSWGFYNETVINDFSGWLHNGSGRTIECYSVLELNMTSGAMLSAGNFDSDSVWACFKDDTQAGQNYLAGYLYCQGEVSKFNDDGSLAPLASLVLYTRAKADISIDDYSMIVGDVTFDWDGTLTISNNSRLFGDIFATGSDSVNITIDSTSAIYGDTDEYSGNYFITFVLKEKNHNHQAIMNVEQESAWGISSITVDITDACNGDYTLIAAQEGTSLSYLRFDTCSVKVVSGGKELYTLSCKDAAENDDVKLSYRDNSLILTVKNGKQVSSGITLLRDGKNSFTGEILVNIDVTQGDTLSITSGGLVSAATVDNGSVKISSGGILSSSEIQGGSVNVSSGGILRNVEIQGGSVNVSSGGILDSANVNADNGNVNIAGGYANQTVVENGGSIAVNNSARIFNTIINSNGSASINNAVMYNTIVNSDGCIDVLAGGISDHGAIFAGGVQNIHNGGHAASANILGGDMHVYKGGVAENTFMSGGTATVHSGGIGSSATVIEAAYNISSGGKADRIAVKQAGELNVFNGAQADNTDVLLNGNMHIFDGGNADDTKIYGGDMHISSGGIANGTVLTCEYIDEYCYSSGNMYISSGGRAVNTEILYGSMVVEYGAVADKTVIYGGDMYISGGSASNIKIENAGYVDLSSGELIDVTVYGILYITANEEEHKATNIIINHQKGYLDSGYVMVDTYSVASNVCLNSGTLEVFGSASVIFNPWQQGEIIEEEGGKVTYLERDAEIYFGNSEGFVSKHHSSEASLNIDEDMAVIVYEGGKLYDTKIIAGDDGSIEGYISIESGASASNTVLSGGFMMVSGNVCNTEISADGMLWVENGGSAFNTEVYSGGTIEVAGKANNTIISSGGSGVFYNEAYDTVISSGGSVEVYDETYDTIVSSGGSMLLNDGAVHRGTMQLAAGAKVTANEGSVIDFTLAGRSKNEGYLINNLALLTGTPDYTITVAEDQEQGIYKLAQGASNFNGTVTIGDGVYDYGNLSVNGNSVEYDNKEYALIRSGGNLSLSITEISSSEPISVAPVVSVSPTDFTNGEVWVEAEFDVASMFCEYSFNGKVWYDYFWGICFEKNGGVYFRSVYWDGTYSDVTYYAVTNIDKTVPTVQGNVESIANGYIINVTGKDDNGIAGYKLRYSNDGINYIDYSGSISGNSVEISDVGEIKYFQIQAIDNAGNESNWKNIFQHKKFPLDVDNTVDLIFISSKYSEKTTGKKQNGITLTFGENAFASLEDAGDTSGKTVILLDSKNSGDYVDQGTVASVVVIPTVKETDNSYSYKATETPKGTLNISQDTDSTEFIRFATVNVTGATVGNITGGKESSSEDTKSAVDKKGTVTDTEKNNYTNNANGKFTALDGSAATVKGYATVNLTSATVTELAGGNTKETSNSKLVDGKTKDQKTISTVNDSVAAGRVTLKNQADADTIRGYSNVTLTDSTVGDITNFTSKDSKSETATYDEAKNTVTRKVTLSHTETTAGTLKSTNVTEIGDVTGFATVTLKNVSSAGDFRRVGADGDKYSTIKETLTVKTKKDGSVTGTYNKTETFTRAGKFTATGSTVGDIENFSNVTLDGSTVEDISNFTMAKVVTKGTASWDNMSAYGRPADYDIDLAGWELTEFETESLNGSVTLKNGASASSITNFKSVTMTASKVGTIENVEKVTVNKGDSAIGSYAGTSGNDTVTIAKGAVLTANKIDLGEGVKDKLAINGTLILTGSEDDLPFVNAAKITGKGEIAVVEDLFDDVSIDFANILNVGETTENFRGTAYENADDSFKKAVKWDGKEEYNGWLGNWDGYTAGSDMADHIKFKADLGDELIVDGISNWTLLDKKGNDIGKEITAAGEYILKLEYDSDNISQAYTITLA